MGKEQVKKESFFDGVKKEFKKIVWPDKSTLGKETAAVIFVSAVTGVLIALVDMGAKFGIDLLLK